MSAFKMKATKPQGGDYEIPPEGSHPAILIAIIDLGTHTQEYKEGRKDMRKVMLVWEMTTEKMSGYKDRNHTIGREYTMTFGPKSLLRGMVEKWRGKAFHDDEEFDLDKMLGKPCLLSIVQKESSTSKKVYARIDGVTAMPKGLQAPPPQHKPFLYEIGIGAVPAEDWIPYLYGEPVKDVIARSKEMTKVANGTANGNGHHEQPMTQEQLAATMDDPDEIPF